MSSTITFHGGAGTVTGANFLLTVEGVQFVIDCGLLQGQKFCDDCNADPFGYDPASVDTLLVTHAHTDHIGRIPRMVRQGFRGRIISTRPTKDIARVMFADALKIMREEEREEEKTVLYEEGDIEQTLSQWETFEYYEAISLPKGVTARFLNAGHILGSAMIELERKGKTFVFSGDLGNAPAPIVQDTDVLERADYLLMESVYGDRVHEGGEDRLDHLKGVIERTQKRKGTLLIPAFSLQRTQSILHDLNHLLEHKHVKQIDVYLDAPLAIKVIDIYRKYSEYFNDHLKGQIEKGDDPFDFESLKLTPHISDSRAIQGSPGPKIIIAGSGMSHGGRIREHERNFLGSKDTTVLFVGHQALHSLGRRLQEGQKKVKIDDEWVKVRAQIETISGYSAHKDRDQLVDFVEPVADSVKEVFVAMGEPRSSLFLVQRLRDFLGVEAVAPDAGESFKIEF